MEPGMAGGPVRFPPVPATSGMAALYHGIKQRATTMTHQDEREKDNETCADRIAARDPAPMAVAPPVRMFMSRPISTAPAMIFISAGWFPAVIGGVNFLTAADDKPCAVNRTAQQKRR